jgi:hypothetical protein
MRANRSRGKPETIPPPRPRSGLLRAERNVPADEPVSHSACTPAEAALLTLTYGGIHGSERRHNPAHIRQDETRTAANSVASSPRPASSSRASTRPSKNSDVRLANILAFTLGMLLSTLT